ncbi:MAG: inorganic diphosphatase [Clostridiales bacterium]|nr:inorganic diphosphatase [Clostridiales bacterium]
MSNVWHDFDPNRISPNDFIAFVEISKGSKKKYELDKDSGLIILDRVLHTSTHYPANYGFIPRTYADDYDPLDVLILCSEALDPMTIVRCYPIGVIKMLDNGRSDEKIIAVPFADPTYNGYRSIFALPKHVYDEMSHFFSVYKSLEGKQTAIDEVMGEREAIAIIQQCIDNYNDKFGGDKGGSDKKKLFRF